MLFSIVSNSTLSKGSILSLILFCKKLLKVSNGKRKPSETTPRNLIAFTRPLSSKNPEIVGFAFLSLCLYKLHQPNKLGLTLLLVGKYI